METLQREGTGTDSHRTLLQASRDTVVWAESLADATPAVFKLYFDRGPISYWREKRFRFRVEREFDVLSHLTAQGIPCSRPLFWNHGASPDYGRYEMLATREIAGAVSLDLLLRQATSEDAQRQMSPLFRTLRAMHAAGCYHGALHVRNILVTLDDVNTAHHWVIDTPSAMIFRRDIAGTRMAKEDLRCFVAGLVRAADESACESGLSAYGMERSEVRAFIAALRPCRHRRIFRRLRRNARRTWLRLEFRLRETVIGGSRVSRGHGQ